ncbi:MAG: hypothetical protein ABSE99_09020 [Terracidiphilus sp.]|jgi:hypothetical protein
MKRAVTGSLAMFFGLCVIVCNIAEAQANTAKSVPSVFEPDDQNRGFEEAKHPSDVVLDALLKTPEAVKIHDELSHRDRESLRSLFEVVRVDLGESGEKGFVALGQGPMTGADCFWFWIVRASKGKAEVLLFSNGLSLSLRKQMTNHYRNIEVDWATAAFIGSRLYRYNGSVYQLDKELTKENK